MTAPRRPGRSRRGGRRRGSAAGVPGRTADQASHSGADPAPTASARPAPRGWSGPAPGPWPRLQPGHGELAALGSPRPVRPGTPASGATRGGDEQRSPAGEARVDDPLRGAQPRRGGEEGQQFRRHRLQHRGVLRQRLGQFRLRAGQSAAPSAWALRALSDVRIGPPGAGPAMSRPTAAWAARNASVKARCTRAAGPVAGRVGAPVIGGAADPAVHATDAGGLALGSSAEPNVVTTSQRAVRPVASRGPRGTPSAAGRRPTPVDCPLTKQRVHSADQRGQVAVHPPDDAVRLEPPGPIPTPRCPYPFRCAGRVTGDARAEAARVRAVRSVSRQGHAAHPRRHPVARHNKHVRRRSCTARPLRWSAAGGRVEDHSGDTYSTSLSTPKVVACRSPLAVPSRRRRRTCSRPWVTPAGCASSSCWPRANAPSASWPPGRDGALPTFPAGDGPCAGRGWWTADG